MKTITLLFLSLFLTNKCQDKKETTETASMAEKVKTEETKPEMSVSKTQEATIAVYEASTRGAFYKIIYQNNQLMVSRDRNNPNGKPFSISKEDFLELTTMLKAIKPEGLEKLKGSTQERHSDGAMHANFKIIQNGKEYQTQGFDAGVPPKEIEKIVSKMISLSEKQL
jgi:hypothetical protein